MSADPNKVACAACPTLKTSRKPSKYPWTADMDDQLRQVYRRSRNRRELSLELSRLASTLRRPKFIIANRAQSLGLSLLPWKPWSKEEILTLRELAGQKGIRTIAKLMKRSYHSVKHQLFRMDLSTRVAARVETRTPLADAKELLCRRPHLHARLRRGDLLCLLCLRQFEKSPYLLVRDDLEISLSSALPASSRCSSDEEQIVVVSWTHFPIYSYWQPLIPPRRNGSP